MLVIFNVMSTGREIAINPKEVSHVAPSFDGSTLIMMANRNEHQLDHDFGFVVAKLNGRP